MAFPISLPNPPSARTVKITQLSNVGVSESPLSFTQQVYAWPAQRWALEVTYPPLVAPGRAEALCAALTSLNGREGTFLFGDPANRAPQGLAQTQAVLATINGAGQTGNSLATKGWTASNLIFKAGDWIQLGGRNLLMQSQAFDNAVWTKNTVTVTANSTTAPDGTVTGDTLAPTGSDNSVFEAFSPAGQWPHTGSVWLRGPGSSVSLTLFVTDSLGVVAALPLTLVGTGWQRFYLTWTPRNTGTHGFCIGGSSSWVSGTIRAWGAQAEPVPALQEYRATTSAAYSQPYRLHKIQADVWSDGSGNATLPIWPALRYSPADGDALTYSNPMTQFRLDAPVSWDIDLAKVYGVSFKATESLP